ncbi:DNA replication domain protein [Erwinia aphidicola]|uniref:DNA replication domain protein n=1 Tax=Erwinia aphidicola TaxID=68334 RepID=UPI0030D275DE
MASSWIKVEVITPDKPEIFQMAEALDIDPDAVLGKLVRIWTWADQQTVDGNAGSVTKSVLDRLSFVTGFADALISVGWLSQEDGRLFFPNFERHNGDSSKKRALTNRRVTEHRKKGPESNAKRNAGSVTPAFQKALPEEEEEEDIKTDPPLTPPKPKKSFPYPAGLNAAAWDEWKQYRRDMKLKAYAPTPRSEGAAITNLLGLSAGDPQRQEEIIRQSMANGWQGLFEIKGGLNHEASRRIGAGCSFKGNAVEAVHAATARMREQHGIAGRGENYPDLGSDGGTVFRQVDQAERTDPAITLDQRHWKTV